MWPEEGRPTGDTPKRCWWGCKWANLCGVQFLHVCLLMGVILCAPTGVPGMLITPLFEVAKNVPKDSWRWGWLKLCCLLVMELYAVSAETEINLQMCNYTQTLANWEENKLLQ